MTNEQIIEMAKLADIWQPFGLPSDWDCGDYVASPHQLHTFAQLVRNAALDEAKEVCRQTVRETNTTLTWEGCSEIQQAIEKEKS